MTTKLRRGVTAEGEAAKRLRLQLDFSPEAHERLMRIRERSDASTNAEVVRNALRIYDWFLEQKVKGGKLQVVDGDTVKEVQILF